MPGAGRALGELGYALPLCAEAVEGAAVTAMPAVGIGAERCVAGAGGRPVAVAPAAVADQDALAVVAKAWLAGMFTHTGLVAAETADAVGGDALLSHITSCAIDPLAGRWPTSGVTAVALPQRARAVPIALLGQRLYAA